MHIILCFLPTYDRRDIFAGLVSTVISILKRYRLGRIHSHWFFEGHYSRRMVYSFIKSQVTDRTCLQSKYKLYEIRPTGTARRLATQWVREQPCKKINRKRKLQLNTVSLLRWRHICHESFRCWWESIPGSLTWEAR